MSYRMVYVYLVTPSTHTTLTSALGLVTPQSTQLVLARYGVLSVRLSIVQVESIIICYYNHIIITHTDSETKVSKVNYQKIRYSWPVKVSILVYITMVTNLHPYYVLNMSVLIINQCPSNGVVSQQLHSILNCLCSQSQQSSHKQCCQDTRVVSVTISISVLHNFLLYIHCSYLYCRDFHQLIYMYMLLIIDGYKSPIHLKISTPA